MFKAYSTICPEYDYICLKCNTLSKIKHSYVPKHNVSTFPCKTCGTLEEHRIRSHVDIPIDEPGTITMGIQVTMPVGLNDEEVLNQYKKRSRDAQNAVAVETFVKSSLIPLHNVYNDSTKRLRDSFTKSVRAIPEYQTYVKQVMLFNDELRDRMSNLPTDIATNLEDDNMLAQVKTELNVFNDLFIF